MQTRLVRFLGSSKKEVMKFVAVVLAVTLLAVTIYNAFPQNQANRQGSNNGSESSTSQSAAYWWSMIRTMAMSSTARVPNSTSTAPSASQTVPLTNQTLWTSESGGVGSSLAVGDGEVFVVSNVEIAACNASTGAVIWFSRGNWSNPGGYVGSPAFADGRVLVCASDDRIYALNATTGALSWSYLTGNVILSSPTVADGVVYVGSSTSAGGVVYALDATTGALVWDRTIDCALWFSAAVVDGVVFISSMADVLALNASTGAVIWTCNTVPQPASPAVVGGVVYVGSLIRNVYALNATTGMVVWTYPTVAGYGRTTPSAVVGGVVYVGSFDHNVYALNATTGALVWNYTTGGWVISSPAVVGGVVYVGSFDDDVYALNAKNGILIWIYKTGSEVVSSPIVDNDVVFVGSNDGNVYAFGQPPFSVSISPSSAEIDVGQPQVFSSHVTGDTSPYTFQWYLNEVPVSGATNTSWTFTPASAGSYAVYLEVTDNFGTLAISGSASVSAVVPPVFSILNPGPESHPSNWNASTTVRYIETPDFIFCSNETSLGSTFFVNITVTNVTDLYAWGIGLVYDNTTLQFVNAWLPTDNVFSGATASGDTLIQPPVIVDTVPYNEEKAGSAIIEWGCTFIQGSKNWCFNGTGTMAQLEFRIIKAPNSTTPQITSTFTLDPNWTTTIYWPTIDHRPEPSLGTASFTYIS
jgi:outer membrane protein assembly factor BamB